jgi:hypothetical protein
MTLSLSLSGVACTGEPQAKRKPDVTSPKAAGSTNTPDAGVQLDAGDALADAGPPDVPIGVADAAADDSGMPATPPNPPPPTTPPPPPTTMPPTTTPPPTTPPPPPTTTPPPPTTTPLRIAAFGDYGADHSSGEGLVADLVHAWAPDHVITTGDNNYESGEASTIDANIGKYYQAFIGSYRGSYGVGSATNRFWPVPGNHDWVAPDLQPYKDYFTLPGNERYYDVDLGIVHIYAIDSDSHEPDGDMVGSTQALWLKERLEESKSCFDLVYFHHPPLSSGNNGNKPEMAWPFELWGADAVLSGDDHDYERFQVGGIPYFVVGLGGAGIYHFTRDPLPETRFRYDEKHGAMLISATATGITFEFWSHDGQKIDSHSVPKACP